MAKKIKVITIHDLGNNFGSTLQACALCDFLTRNGHTVELIDYKPKYAYHHGIIADFVKLVLYPKSYISQKRRFEKYFNDHVVRTKRYKTYKDLCSDPKADVYIVGSDQVWNEFYNAGRDDAYYLAFTDCQNKMAYSTSLGQSHTVEELKRVKDRTKSFRAIGVREKISVEELHSIGMSNVKHVLDPVFLCDKDYYIDSCYTNPYGKYILVYSINDNELMEQLAIKTAKRLGAKIVLVGGYRQKTKHDIYLRGIGPYEFANLINKAEYVIANSFHATAMSLILNKQFALVMSKYSPMRLVDILETAGISDRIIRNEDEIVNAEKAIDYSAVNARIKSMRIQSEEFLLSSINTMH